MQLVARFWGSALGKKLVMAITGLLMVGFVVVHMAGNLQVFVGAEKLNAYADLLHGPLAEVVWIARVVLLGAVALHVTAAVQLTRQAQAARPSGYARRTPQVSTFASRTIRWGGALLLVFIVLHILHFTTRTLFPADLQDQSVKIFSLVTDEGLGFRNPLVAGFYVLSMAGLGLHLFHGVWSSPRTLGLAPATNDPIKRRLALGLAVVVAVGFAAVPLAIFLGLVK